MTNVHVRVKGSTVCKIDEEGKRHFTWQVDNLAYRKENDLPLVDVTELRKKHKISDEEVLTILKKTDLIENEYFRLRAKAIVSIARVFGKRRGEIVLIQLDELNINKESNELEINFHLLKKRKMGLFQYIKFLEKKISKGEMTHSEFQAKTQGQLITEWKQWRETDAGLRKNVKVSLHSVSLDSPFAQMIIDYWNYVKSIQTTEPLTYLFTKGKSEFGRVSLTEYAFYPHEHLRPQRLLEIVQSLDPFLWMHLFRKKRGSEIAMKMKRSIDAVFSVKNELDLADERSAWHYIEETVAKKADI